MKKHLLLGLLLGGFACFSNAQTSTTWLGPGARWGYSYLSNGGNQGNFFLYNAGDTLLDGQTFTRLLEHYEPSGGPLSIDDSEHYLIARNDSILWRYEAGQPLFVLYDFTRKPGDLLPPLPWLSPYVQQTLVVKDTGTTLWDNSIPVRYQEINVYWHLGPQSYIQHTRLYERVGNERDFFNWSIVASPLYEVDSHLFCYRDNEYPLSDCVSATTEPARLGVRVFPNPARQFFRVELPDDTPAARLRLYDLHGQVLADQPGTQNTFDTAPFSPGLYVLEVQTTDGRRGWEKIVVAP